MCLVDRICILIYFILLFGVTIGQIRVSFTDEKKLHVPLELTFKDLAQLVKLNNETYLKDILTHILVPRVVGSESHEKVKEFIGSELKSLNWDVEFDTFLSRTPNLGKLQFTNIIARLDPSAPRYLTLACHYDSKYFKKIKFVGAIDSAVPCAMLVHMAKVLTPYIRHKNPRVSLMLVFFDGEEAFEKWSDIDSLYGARNLAQKWHSTPYLTTEAAHFTHLNRLDMLVLLDLIGTRDTTFHSFFPETERWHQELADIENKMKANGLVDPHQPLHFLERSTISFIEDDHIPFLERGVPILHLIPLHFPVNIWHTEKDNYTALDFPTIETINKVLIGFVYSYLNGNLVVK